MGVKPKPHLSAVCAKPFLARNACLFSAFYILYLSILSFPPLHKASLFFFLPSATLPSSLFLCLHFLFPTNPRFFLSSRSFLSTTSPSSVFPSQKQKLYSAPTHTTNTHETTREKRKKEVDVNKISREHKMAANHNSVRLTKMF